MEEPFWQNKWRENQIGFHQLSFNEHLQAHWPSLYGESGTTLVPLCGKSLDLKYLAQYGHTVGIEYAQTAIQQYFQELRVEPIRGQQWGYPSFTHQQTTLLRGDFFRLGTAVKSEFDYVYDRAALIALRPDTREAYVECLAKACRRGAINLTITIDYAQHEMQGPPFALGPRAVEDLYGRHFKVDCLFSSPPAIAEGGISARGVSTVQTHVFKMVRS